MLLLDDGRLTGRLLLRLRGRGDLDGLRRLSQRNLLGGRAPGSLLVDGAHHLRYVKTRLHVLVRDRVHALEHELALGRRELQEQPNQRVQERLSVARVEVHQLEILLEGDLEVLLERPWVREALREVLSLLLNAIYRHYYEEWELEDPHFGKLND